MTDALTFVEPETLTGLATIQMQNAQTLRVVARDTESGRAGIATSKQRHAKLTERGWRLAHDVGGMRIDLAEVTDDQTRTFGLLSGIQRELEHVRGEMTRQVLLLEVPARTHGTDVPDLAASPRPSLARGTRQPHIQAGTTNE